MWFIVARLLLVLYVLVLFVFLVRLMGLMFVKQRNHNLQDFSVVVLFPFYVLTKKGREILIKVWNGIE